MTITDYQSVRFQTVFKLLFQERKPFHHLQLNVCTTYDLKTAKIIVMIYFWSPLWSLAKTLCGRQNKRRCLLHTLCKNSIRL